MELLNGATKQHRNRSGYFIRLWRGEQKLRVAFWGWSIGFPFLLWVCFAVWFTLDSEAFGGESLGSVSQVFSQIYFFYGWLMCVVLYRTAARYKGRPLWGYLTFIWVAVYAACIVFTVHHFIVSVITLLALTLSHIYGVSSIIFGGALIVASFYGVGGLYYGWRWLKQRK